MQLDMYITLYYNYISLLLQYYKLYIYTHLSVLISLVSKYIEFPDVILFLTVSSPSSLSPYFSSFRD